MIIKASLYFLLFCALALLFTNPSHDRFLDKVGSDYGSIHSDRQLTNEELLEMGEVEYINYFLWGEFTYTFGSIKVHYLGILGKIYFRGSEVNSSVPLSS